MTAIYNFHQATAALACSGQPTEEQLSQLAAGNYDAIVNLALTGTKFSLADEAAAVGAAGKEYYHIPVVFDDPQLNELEDFTDFMNLHAEKKILVHCAANYRASVLMGLYLYSAGKLRKHQLMPFVAKIWQPDAVWQ